MRCLLLLFTWVVAAPSWAQGWDVAQQQQFPRVSLSSNSASEAFDWWANQAEAPAPIEWAWQATFESPGGWHHRFQAQFGGLPLHGAELLFFVDRQNTLRGAQWADIQDVPTSLPPISAQAALWVDGQWRWIRWSDREASHPRSWERTAFDAFSGEALQTRDMLLHATDSVGRALVFRPDPLARAGVTYGGAYIDDNDQNTAVLDPLRDTVSVGLTYSNGFFTLENSAAVIQELDAPVVAIPTQAQSDFFFSRSDAGFEMTNALYHIERIRSRLDSLGFGSLITYAIPVDVNAFNGIDNSAFDRATNPPRLLFGEGGVDDAEDSDVIAHEYGHALSHAAAPFTVNGTERECLEEALCDYFAMSHSYRWETWRHQYIFHWDGHNPFWGGRMGFSTKDYSQLTFSSIYSHTDVFADPLGVSMASLGPDAMDRIVLESMYNFSSFMTMPQAANWMLLADTVLNGGQNASLLHLNFAARNILSPQVGQPEDLPSSGTASDRWVAGNARLDFTDVEGMAFDMEGRRVLTWRAGATLDASALPAGIYAIQRADGSTFRLYVRP